MAKKIKGKQDDLELDQSLRPSAFGDYFGQEAVKEHIKLIIEAAKQRGESFDHLLFYGQAGLGKTTLAYLVAGEMGAAIRTTTGPSLTKPGDVVAVLSSLEPNEILFIDEVHRMSRPAEEVLYPAMESRKMHLVIGKGPAARTMTLTLPSFTIIAATTRANLLSAPLRSRFGGTFRLDYYKIQDIERIIMRSAGILGVRVASEASARLARAARFTPRIANRLLKRARDYAQLYNNNVVDENVVLKALELLQVDELGLEDVDRRLLETVIIKFGGGPVGLEALGAALDEDEGTITEVYEPYLMSIGFLQRTRLGRVATEKARKHLGY